LSQEQAQVVADASRYTLEEQLSNSVRDVAGSWLLISLIGICFGFFMKGVFYFAPYIWAIVSVWLWRTRSIAAARVLLGIALSQFLLALWSKFVSPVFAFGWLWSGILLVAAIHAWHTAKALEQYRQDNVAKAAG
jgi:hypothetical protein